MEKAKVNYTVGEATRLWLDAYRGTETFFVQCMDALRAQYGEREAETEEHQLPLLKVLENMQGYILEQLNNSISYNLGQKEKDNKIEI